MTAAAPFSGIYPMLHAFFGADGRLDRGAMRAQVAFAMAERVHGLAVLGLATEVGKLSAEEKRQIIAWTAEDLGGRLPLAVTLSGATPEEQLELARVAEAAGAAWLILQPPAGGRPSRDELIAFFGAVMTRIALPIAIQNAPEYLGVGLDDAGLAELARRHANFTMLKGEASALAMRRTIAATSGRLAVFNGRGGLELPANLRAGCAGMIPGLAACGVQARIFEKLRTGRAEDAEESERLYAAILPLLVFLMQSLDAMICYGKRWAAPRLGLAAIHDRAPAMNPDDFGLAELARYSTIPES